MKAEPGALDRKSEGEYTHKMMKAHFTYSNLFLILPIGTTYSVLNKFSFFLAKLQPNKIYGEVTPF